MEFRLKHGKSLDGSQIAGALDGDMISFVQECFAYQVDALLRAVRDKYFIRTYFQPFFLKVSLRDIFPQRQVAFSRAVLKDVPAVVLKDF
jgi:hypothetical protein